jgi:hypothetical protein
MSSNEYKCHRCKCVNYPDCEYGNEFCDTCVDAGTGSHLKVDRSQTGIPDVFEHYEECSNCSDYNHPDKLSNGICEKCISEACDKCGDITESCDCYQD